MSPTKHKQKHQPTKPLLNLFYSVSGRFFGRRMERGSDQRRVLETWTFILDRTVGRRLRVNCSLSGALITSPKRGPAGEWLLNPAGLIGSDPTPNLTMYSPDPTTAKIDEPIHSNSLLHQFINGSDAFRSSRFKIVNKIVKGPWIVKTAKLMLLIFGYCYRNFAASLGVCDRGDSRHGVSGGGTKEEELPERLFGAVRICQMEMSSATYVDNVTPTSKVLPMSSGGESENEDD
ncbi:UNVERIFIED_CONTAM: hypothetical protein Scaly_2365500 [Sesamum calycinum]|uniref:Protein ENHANCED DISEASE RESISTANCE 2 C-terminal domain-containing protein n=1 Tax=Sesamum calycinum TaxID=2727403 RepID=A0AAW2LY08_9LAMI